VCQARICHVSFPSRLPCERLSFSAYARGRLPNQHGRRFRPHIHTLTHTHTTADDLAFLLGTGAAFALQHNRIQDVALLGRCASLRFLTLAHNFLSDVSPLASLPNLLFLDVSYNTLADVEQLVGKCNGGAVPAVTQEGRGVKVHSSQALRRAMCVAVGSRDCD
jgi:hypothetical protein